MSPQISSPAMLVRFQMLVTIPELAAEEIPKVLRLIRQIEAEYPSVEISSNTTTPMPRRP